MRRCSTTVVAAVAAWAMALLWVSGAHAAYRFEVPKLRCDAFIRPDASARLVYEIELHNLPGGQAIDVVDVGLPHGDYDTSNMSASVGGRALTDIHESSYIDTGVEVRLGLAALAPRQRATLHFEATLPDLVFADTTSDALASFRITPTWFDPRAVVGTTELALLVHLPPGVEATQVLHQGKPFFRKAELADHALVVWRWPHTHLTGPHLVGLSFPRAVMTRVVSVSRLELLALWWEASSTVRLWVGLGMALMLVVCFLRFTGATGWSVLTVVLGGAGYLFYVHPRAQLYALPLWIAVSVLMEWRTQKRHRRGRRDYLPPIVSVEGAGIKRGLTAPEAAVLLEMSLGKVLTLVIFGMLKKRLIEIVTSAPLEVRIAAQLRAGRGSSEDPAARRRQRLQAAVKMGSIVHVYEHGFLEALANSPGEPVREIRFSVALERLIAHTARRVENFDVEKTRRYYRYQIGAAWREAKRYQLPEPRAKAIDSKIEWLLLDDDCDAKLRSMCTVDFHYQPRWLRADTGGGGASIASAAAGSVPRTADLSAPSFGDVSASFAGWIENVSGGVAAKLSPFGAAGAGSGGVIDLSGVDHVTGAVLKGIMSSSGGGGGGGCACAGCACACACAGGGR